MFVASYHNTMSDQRPKRINIASAAKRRRLLEEAAQRDRIDKIERATERLQQQVDAANDAIAWANKKINVMTFADVMGRISRATGVSAIDIISERRSTYIVFARQAVIYWCCRRTTLSLPQIGRRLKRDHTTMVHARRRYVEKRAEMGRSLRSLDNRYGPGGQRLARGSAGAQE